MKTKKLIKLSRSILSEKKRAEAGQVKLLKDIQKQLKSKKKNLHERLKTESDKSERQELKERLSIITAQRKKIITRLKGLK